ncbi:MAG: hypothetical protein PVG14_07015 [Anaerolineales bacterium]
MATRPAHRPASLHGLILPDVCPLGSSRRHPLTILVATLTFVALLSGGLAGKCRANGR